MGPLPTIRPRGRIARLRLTLFQIAALLGLLVIVAAAATAAALFWHADQGAIERDWAEHAATALRHEVDEGGVTLRGLRGLMDARPDLTAAEFAGSGRPPSAAPESSDSPGSRACPRRPAPASSAATT